MGADLKVLNNKTGLYKSHPPPPGGWKEIKDPRGREGKRVRKRRKKRERKKGRKRGRKRKRVKKRKTGKDNDRRKEWVGRDREGGKVEREVDRKREKWTGRELDR